MAGGERKGGDLSHHEPTYAVVHFSSGATLPLSRDEYHRGDFLAVEGLELIVDTVARSIRTVAWTAGPVSTVVVGRLTGKSAVWLPRIFLARGRALTPRELGVGVDTIEQLRATFDKPRGGRNEWLFIDTVTRETANNKAFRLNPHSPRWVVILEASQVDEATSSEVVETQARDVRDGDAIQTDASQDSDDGVSDQNGWVEAGALAYFVEERCLWVGDVVIRNPSDSSRTVDFFLSIRRQDGQVTTLGASEPPLCFDPGQRWIKPPERVRMKPQDVIRGALAFSEISDQELEQVRNARRVELQVEDASGVWGSASVEVRLHPRP